MIAVSRRASKPLPAQTASSRRRPSSGTTGRLLRNDRRLHPRHRVGVDLLFLKPAVQDAQDLVAGGRRRRRPPPQQIAQKRLPCRRGLPPLAACPGPRGRPRLAGRSAGRRRACARSGSPPPGAAGTSGATNSVGCYPAFPLVVLLRKSYKDGVNRCLPPRARRYVAGSSLGHPGRPSMTTRPLAFGSAAAGQPAGSRRPGAPAPQGPQPSRTIGLRMSGGPRSARAATRRRLPRAGSEVSGTSPQKGQVPGLGASIRLAASAGTSEATTVTRSTLPSLRTTRTWGPS